jgi:CDP-diacylglycerol---serine O-phosphatidyltransferase
MNRQLFTLPNLMTCGNLLCGCLGIINVLFEGSLSTASLYIFLACILDFLDGFVARALKSSSPIGKELDSLADMVTFGVLPAMILFFIPIGGNIFHLRETKLDGLVCYGIPCLSYLPLLLTIFSALRLAKFNIDTRQSDSFIGVPTPANAIVVASFPLILDFNPEYAQIIQNQYFLIGYTLIMSYLLISEIPLFALKFKSFAWGNNQIKYIFLIVSVLLLVVFKFVGIPLVILLYLILSVVNNIFLK